MGNDAPSATRRRRSRGMASAVAAAHECWSTTTGPSARDATPPLWQVYQNSLKGAKYVDLTHTITPQIPVWAGFGPATFGPTISVLITVYGDR